MTKLWSKCLAIAPIVSSIAKQAAFADSHAEIRLRRKAVCFFAGCCYGKETESFFSVIFQNSEYAPNHVALIPTQLYSSGLDFLHFLLLLLIARNKKADGQVTACYLIFYSVGRFVIEFFRGDIIRGSVGILSTSQFISIFTGIAGVVMMILVSRRTAGNEAGV